MFGVIANIAKAIAAPVVVDARPELSEDMKAFYRCAAQRMKWINYDRYGEPFFIYSAPTPELMAEKDLEDAFGYLNDMVACTDDDIGESLGQIYMPQGGYVFTMPHESVNPKTAGLSIDFTEGYVRVADPAKLALSPDNTTGEEIRTIPITVHPVGTFNINITILNGTGNILLYDAENGNDANDGKTKKRALKTLQRQGSLRGADKVLLKRGSVFEDSYTIYISSKIGTTWKKKIYGAYGNPMHERPIIRAPAGYSGYVMEPHRKNTNGTGGYQTYGNITFRDIIFDANYSALRCIYSPGGSDFTVLRCKVMNSKADANANGMRFENAVNLKVKHCESENLYGEALYTTNAKNREARHNHFKAPLGHTDDIDQNSEGNGYNLISEHNIKRRLPVVGASKGSTVYEHCQYVFKGQDHIDGVYFCDGVSAGPGATAGCVAPMARRPEGANQADCYLIGIGDTQDTVKYAIVGNLMGNSWNGTIMKSMGYKRYDLVFGHNTYFNCSEAALNIYGGMSGRVEGNSFIDCRIGVNGPIAVQNLTEYPASYRDEDENDNPIILTPEYTDHVRRNNLTQVPKGFYFPVGLDVRIDTDPREGQTMHASVINAEPGSEYQFVWVLNKRIILSETDECTVPFGTIENYVDKTMPDGMQGAEIRLFLRVIKNGRIATPVGKWADRSIYKYVLPA